MTRGANLGTGTGMADWNPFLPVIYSSIALLLVALGLAVVLVPPLLGLFIRESQGRI
jgi:hypothetical protein